MSAPKVTAVAEASPAAQAGLKVGDELASLNGRLPRDVIEYQQLIDEPELDIVVRRPGHDLDRRLVVRKEAGEPLGLEISAAVFDRVRTCDNHCSFCFIHQLPKGMRRSLYLKDDDYRLSFLYGNFTTLTRFTELDVERVIDERLGPLFVSIHATDPTIRAQLLRNPRGATSLRWLHVLLEAGIEVHGQIVVCPGINDGAVLEDTMCGILDRFPAIATVGVVPLGTSRYTKERSLRRHTTAEARAVCHLAATWQEIFAQTLGRRLVYLADEYYLLASYRFPEFSQYDGFPQHENGIGMARAFEAAFNGSGPPRGVKPGFFAWVEGAPAEGYRAPHRDTPLSEVPDLLSGNVSTAKEQGEQSQRGERGERAATVVTGAYGAQVIEPLIAEHYPEVRVLPVENRFFGGNIGVAGLLTGADLAEALRREPTDARFLLPDACLSKGQFIDGLRPGDLPRLVEIVGSDGWSLRCALEGGAFVPPKVGADHGITSSPITIRSRQAASKRRPLRLPPS